MAAGAWANAGVALLVAATSGVGLLFPSLRGSRTALFGSESIASLGGHRLLQGLTRNTLLDVTHLTLVPWADAGGLFVTFWIDAYARLLGPGAALLLVAWCIAMFAANRSASAPARAALLAVPAGVVAYCGAMLFLLGGVGRHFAPGLVVTALRLLVWQHRPVTGRAGPGMGNGRGDDRGRDPAGVANASGGAAPPVRREAGPGASPRPLTPPRRRL